LVTSERISRANGLLTMATFLAIILGTFLASFLTDISGRNVVLGAFFCTVVAIIGFITSFYISYTPPAGSTKKLNPLVPYEIYATLKGATKQHCLLTSVFGSAFMMFIGAFFQLNIIPYAIQCLGLTDVQGGYLFLLTAVGIGTGSVLAGKMSGRFVELGLVPFAGAAIIFGYFALDWYSESLPAVIALTLGVGVFGGIFVIPFDTFIQVVSPANKRGQLVAATNVMGFLGVLIASITLSVISEVFGLRSDKGFTIVGCINLGILTVITISIIDYFVRFLAMLASRVLFKIRLDGHEKVPTSSASIIIANYSSWYDSILVMGAQRRAIHLYLEGPSPFPGRDKIAGLLRILPTSIEGPLEQQNALLEQIRKNAARGISSCIFVEDGPAALDRMRSLQGALEDVFEQDEYPVVSIHIEKSEKCRLSFWSKLTHKLREPAHLRFHLNPVNLSRQFAYPEQEKSSQEGAILSEQEPSEA
jgi:acyl-[acyl-carrier-protein]-phospholipid O-acyltransferase/long-chain-fatty-acid--[acyl-carrier-protein] ligase